MRKQYYLRFSVNSEAFASDLEKIWNKGFHSFSIPFPYIVIYVTYSNLLSCNTIIGYIILKSFRIINIYISIFLCRTKNASSNTKNNCFSHSISGLNIDFLSRCTCLDSSLKATLVP